MIKTIFFDWGGVVADDPGDDFLSGFFRSIGANDAQYIEIIKTYLPLLTRGQIAEVDFWQNLREKYGFEIEDTISERFKDWKGLVANKDILDFINNLREHNYKVSLITNMIEPSYNILKAAGYFEYFDEVIASCKVGFGKPEKQIYEIALQATRSMPEESLFIDDKVAFLEPATRLGIGVILAQNPQQIIEDVTTRLNGGNNQPNS